jgi:hypothetical protein
MEEKEWKMKRDMEDKMEDEMRKRGWQMDGER